MKRHILFLASALLLALAGCRSSDPEPADTADPSIGTEPVLDDDGLPIDCSILYDGLCYRTLGDAARAAGEDPDRCSVLETYPGKLACDDTGSVPED